MHLKTEFLSPLLEKKHSSLLPSHQITEAQPLRLKGYLQQMPSVRALGGYVPKGCMTCPREDMSPWALSSDCGLSTLMAEGQVSSHSNVPFSSVSLIFIATSS